MLEELILTARKLGASDLHLEPGLPACLRIQGELSSQGAPLDAGELAAAAQALVGSQAWTEFLRQRSCDTSRTVAGTRCRINVLQTVRGVGLAIRLLSSFQATLARLNLHPDLARFCRAHSGLVIVSGATGSGKSSTLAALIHEINVRQARHILTIESPIEYYFRPQAAFIRQRQVGRDTPSFEQALIDALREDPDVLVVGEMRTAEVMRLTLNAAETGHLVFTTLHAASAAEAMGRIVSAFPAEIERSVCTQLADCLRGVICQRLTYHERWGVRLPECEILAVNDAARAIIRSGDTFKLASVLETGRADGMWSRERYRAWLAQRDDVCRPGSPGRDLPDRDLPDTEPEEPARPQPAAASVRSAAAGGPSAAGPRATPLAQSDSSEQAEIDSLITQLKGH